MAEIWPREEYILVSPQVANVSACESAKTRGNMSKVFISYSHKDRKLLAEILTHFQALRNARRDIDYWSDERIPTGSDWVMEIAQAMQRSDVVILVISTDFLASHFIKNNEIPAAIRRANLGESYVMPLLARPAATSEHKWLKNIQIKMQNGKALSELSKPKRERLLIEFINEVCELLDKKKHAR